MSTSVYSRYRAAFAQALANALGVPAADIEAQVKPAEPAHGDLSFATFPLAKAQKKAPPAIAAGLAQSLSVPGLEIKAVGPYVNARFPTLPFTAEVIDAARSAGIRYGGDEDAGRGKTVAIDYSSPNIAKPIGFHHIRTTFLGHCIANIYRALGWRVEGINYLGDWGKQFGLVAVGFQEYGDPARIDDMGHLVEVYVKANKRAEAEPEFDEKARAFFRRMEAGDAEALKLWNQFRDTSIKGFKKIYARMGIEFEHIEGESRYQGKMDAVIDQIAKKPGVKESQGALIVDLTYAENEPPILLKKNDGSTLYATRDLAAAQDRYERFQFDKSLYVVAQDQALHFRQVFRALKEMDLPWADRTVHVAFGRIHGMSTRKGQVVQLNDVLDEARERVSVKVRENVEAGRIQTDDADALSEQIALGAIAFGDLKHKRASDYTFDWDEVLSFEGHTGPYLQYAHARAVNVLRKGGGAPASYDAALLTLPEEQALLREIMRLPEVVRDAAEQYEPSLVARLLLDVASALSRYYTLGNQERDKRINVEGNDALRSARLALIDAARVTLAAGLTLLGIPTPDNM
ncbi:arginyl-tRNA synthetase [Myxococcus xanthus DK 1622]|uniref:Arginine--tRNA ligase n=2 Tax=Myxococcus xanthus TaxID=34 RepID=Q1D785_MYXXD|nr:MULTISPECIES: arginine--tRNA ligase [Myxococcus]AAK59398.1 Arg-tRNA synthetase [Myxococcus xanthus DZF1]ABF91619.1 arginyl-tRNA synthetase [Myxococcus xanthus DK 1622]NOJ57613.1 arginine--tRNA ligase [Myxococcus xanthus]QPM82730.1 arginine--tRNA ligase [Myxococcus xanthus]QVW65035.1 arginine--tRNA ligase [Myxococcus xanthus DZ2]